MQHIPDVHEKSVIYYGWYSNRTRGKRRAQAAEHQDQGEQAAPADEALPSPPPAPIAVRRAWAAMIKRVYEVDPLKCPECDGAMYIVSFIETSQIPAMHSVLVSGKT